MRRLLLLLFVIPALLLTACANEVTPKGDPALAGIKVTGEAGKAPEVTGVKGVVATSVLSSVVSEGSGAVVADGDTIDVHYVLYVATDGASTTSTYEKGAPVTLTLKKAEDKLISASLVDKKIGSRVIIAAPAAEFYGAENAKGAGMAAEDTLILIVEIVSKFAPPAVNGSIADVTVTGDFGKEPKVTAKPDLVVEKTESKVLTAGTGAVTKQGDKVTVRYIGVNARTGKTFDSSYADGGQPAEFVLDNGSVIAGFVKGLVGHKVGSRVLITIPSADGYGNAGQPAAEIKGGDSLIFVVDLVKKS